MKKWIYLMGVCCLTSQPLQGHAFPRGSLYQLKESPYTTFIAQQPGDILTVVVEEAASTTNNGSSTSERSNTQELSLDKIFFPYFKINTGLDDINGGGDPAGLSWTSSNKFNGTGAADSTHNVQTTMQVRIVEEIQEGHYYIRGCRNLNIDGRDRKLHLSGVIRQRDIDPSNTISSSKIADAVIEIEGDMSHEVLKPGLIHKIFNLVF